MNNFFHELEACDKNKKNDQPCLRCIKLFKETKLGRMLQDVMRQKVSNRAVEYEAAYGSFELSIEYLGLFDEKIAIEAVSEIMHHAKARIDRCQLVRILQAKLADRSVNSPLYCLYSRFHFIF